MSTCRFAALAAIAVWGYLSQPAHDTLMAIVDFEAPVADIRASMHLRSQVLADAEQLAPLSYFELTAAAVSPVPESARDSFLRATPAWRPSTPAGMALTFNEATEILRKNEAVRDAVIVRACSASPAPGCGSAVHVAATTLVEDVERTSTRKLQHLVETVSSRSAATVILVTAGWPYRDEQRLRLPAAVQALRRSGATLIIVRLPAAVSYQLLVKDATEALALRLAATFIALDDDRGLARVHDVLAAQIRATVNATPAAPAPAVAAKPKEASVAEKAPAPLGLTDDVLRRAAEYVDRFERTFSAVIWREQYQQEVRMPRRFGASGTWFPTLAARRLLDSELLFVWLPGDASWIAVRDVLAIDGQPQPASDRPLPGLVKSDAVSVDQLKRLATANGRFNIGGIVRTFNEPTLALLFLDDQYRHRFAFTRRGEESVSGEPAATYEFVEHARPTVIRDQDRDLPVRGTLWIDATTGRILQTALELAYPDRRLEGRMTVQYRLEPQVRCPGARADARALCVSIG